MNKPVRLKDIAEGLNVSIMTVSKAINGHPDISEKRRTEILEYVKSVNYVPNQVAKNFRQQKTKTVAIILSNNSNPYNARIIRGIEETLSSKGYYTVIMNSQEDAKKELKLVKELRGLNVAGVLLTPAAGNKKSCEFLRQFNIPYVLVNRYIQENEDTYVVIDDKKAAFLATRHLCSFNYDKVFFLNYLSSVSSTQNRLLGYQEALAKCDVEADESWVISDCVNQLDGYEAMKKILEKNKPPFSVLCYSDYIAIGAICALQEREIRIPDDVAVMGNDDIEILSFVKPRLSTIGVPKLRLGSRCAELLIDLIEKKDIEEKRILMKPELIIRETS